MSLIAFTAVIMGMLASAYSQDPDVCAGVLTTDLTYNVDICSSEQDGATFTLPLTGLSCDDATCTITFSYAGGATPTTTPVGAANTATITSGGTVSACGAVANAAGTVTLAEDADPSTTCAATDATPTSDQYTHLCAVVTCNAKTSFSCLALDGTGTASDGCSGLTPVPDVSVGTLVILTPPLATTLCDAEVKDATFTLVLTGLTCAAATCTDVEFYYSASDAAPGGSAEKYDATSGDVTVPVCSDTPTTFSVAGKMVTLDEEADDCSDYTHLCAIVTCTSETTVTDNFVCVTLDGSTPSTAAGTTMEAATENAATTTTPGYLVLPLVMYAVMSN